MKGTVLDFLRISGMIIITLSLLYFIFRPNNNTLDYPLTKEQIKERVTSCSDRNLISIMIYDEELNVWAVKCSRQK